MTDFLWSSKTVSNSIHKNGSVMNFSNILTDFDIFVFRLNKQLWRLVPPLGSLITFFYIFLMKVNL